MGNVVERSEREFLSSCSDARALYYTWPRLANVPNRDRVRKRERERERVKVKFAKLGAREKKRSRIEGSSAGREELNLTAI
jgi:hypothetical protein